MVVCVFHTDGEVSLSTDAISRPEGETISVCSCITTLGDAQSLGGNFDITFELEDITTGEHTSTCSTMSCMCACYIVFISRLSLKSLQVKYGFLSLYRF